MPGVAPTRGSVRSVRACYLIHTILMGEVARRIDFSANPLVGATDLLGVGPRSVLRLAKEPLILLPAVESTRNGPNLSGH